MKMRLKSSAMALRMVNSKIALRYFSGGRSFGRLEDKDFGALALCINCLSGSSDNNAYGTWCYSTINGRNSRRSENKPGMILFFAVLMLVPMIMAFLSLTLKDSLNRQLNIIVGAAFSVLWFVSVIEAIQSAYWGGALMTLSAAVASSLVVWYAWKHRLAS